MPLSDHEQKIIKELEEELAAADPRLARALSLRGIRRRSLRLAGSGVAIMYFGIMSMVAGLRIESVPLGVGSFFMMASGLYISTLPAAITVWRRRARSIDSDAQSMPDP
jgi:hypothetical protein